MGILLFIFGLYQKISILMEEEVEITVSHPEQKSEIGGVNKFYVYSLKGKDGKGDIDITRRYSDFNVLREVLIKRWPGCYIPSLPEKKTIGSGQHLFIESRRRGLQIFLQTLTLNTAIWDSEELNIFLRNNSGDVQKQLSHLLKESTEKLLAKYKSVFIQFDKDEIHADASVKISQFSSYIKDSKVFLQKLAESTDNMNLVFRQNLQRKLSFLEFLLPDYEKSCLLQNQDKMKTDSLLFANQDLQLKSVIEKYKSTNEYPSVMLITEQIKRQKHELESFDEAIKILHEFQSHKMKSTNKVKEIELKGSKINAGKESFFSKIKKQTKEEQLSENQHEMEKAKEEEKLYVDLTQIITNLIGLREIERFKIIRQKAYYKMLKTFAEFEKEMTMAEREIWSRVAEHDKIGEGDQSFGLKNEGFVDKEEETKPAEETKPEQ